MTRFVQTDIKCCNLIEENIVEQHQNYLSVRHTALDIKNINYPVSCIEVIANSAYEFDLNVL